MKSLEQHWQQLAAHSPRAVAEAAWHSLHIHYTEPVRAYHNLEHLQELFAWAVRLHPLFERPELVHWAIFYHDIIYLPGSGNNEELSADVAVQVLPELAVSDADVQLIASWIRASKSHMLPTAADTPDARLFLDMDLAILGADAGRYERYTQQVRLEYKRFPSLLFNAGRRKVLRHYIDKERIFATDFMHETLDQQARTNLRSELERL